MSQRTAAGQERTRQSTRSGAPSALSSITKWIKPLARLEQNEAGAFASGKRRDE
jgi:hypothetical protein